MAKFAVILAAAGRSSRFADQHYKKPFAPLANRAVWLHSAEKFLARDDVAQVILVIAEEDREDFAFKFASNAAILGVDVAIGGAERSDSIQRALEKLKAEIDHVAVHDAARPCIADQWIGQVFEAAEKSGAAILALPVSATLKRSGDGKTIDETFPREGLWEAQTPQAFRRELIERAYAERKGQATDDSQLVEALGHKVTLVRGSPVNIKITTREDLRLAEQALKALPKPKFSGPAHPFADDDMWR